MKSIEDVEKFFTNAAIGTNANMDEAVLNKVLIAHEKATNTKSAVMQPKIRRTVMKSPITKLAAAAVVVIAVLVGISLLDGSATSVAWSEVVRKVEASRGLIVRCTEANSFMPEKGDYLIKYFCPTHSRTDTYKGGLITRSFYSDFETKTFTGVFHTRKHYLTGTIGTEIEGFLEKHEDWTNPGYIVETILSCEHTRLEQRIIEGVLCEGIETTDPAFLGPMPEVDRLEAQLRLCTTERCWDQRA
ncbi:MAG: hypothetical protein ACYSWQ_17790 [Planctomycetota bacterium]|jgi:hypothetical protein